ncbi:hypothetical protein M1466_03125 [Candidatus Dependentiae bacterium]|nr:hypothetical protein [Candidatus Dependentiae bacterium]
MISKQMKLLAVAGLLLATNETVCVPNNRMGTQDPLGINERLQALESAKRIAAAEQRYEQEVRRGSKIARPFLQ